MVFPVVMYGCESWTIKKAEHRRIDAFELWCWRRLLRVPWLQGDQPVHPKGDQSWIFIGRTDVEAETPIFWPLDAKNQLIGKDPDAGKDWRQEEKGMTENEKVGWHYWCNGHEFEQALGVGDGQESLVCCSPWGHKESDTTERLNWTELNILMQNSYCTLKDTNYSCFIFHQRSESESRPVVSNSLRPNRLQHARLPCPSPSPGACSNSRPSSRWCHPTISSSVVPFSSRLPSFPA